MSLSDSSLTVIRDATCTACGCLCDDIDISVQQNRIVEAERACELAISWFLDRAPEDGPACLVEQQVATVEEGIERAAKILTEAKYPIVFGLGETTCESQRVAVSIGDWIGANIDTTTSIDHGPTGMAFDGVGEVTCSLGEVANRGDFLLFWHCDPAKTHPRHFSRYSLTPKGMFLPRGRADRTCVVVDSRKTKSAESADLFLEIQPECDFEALWILRALAKGLPVDEEQARAATGVELAAWQDLMDRMKRARFGVIVFGTELTRSRGKHLNAEAVLALVRDMNEFARFAAAPLRGRGNLAGADNVLAWQTGFPFGVNLARGYPRFGPGEYTANKTLARGETDAALIVASDPAAIFDGAARERLLAIGLVVIDSRITATTRAATVAFRTATYGIDVAGTAYRMDEVPIPLRPALESSYPSDGEILSALERRIRQIKGISAET